jgi:Ca2+:H+ antiporter
MASSDGPDGQGEVETCSPPAEPLPSLRLSPRSLSRLNSYLDVLLILVPIGLVSGALGWPAKAVFPLNFLAVIPLSPKITFAIRQLSARLGEVGAELCRVITSHPVGIIVSVLQPRKLLSTNMLIGGHYYRQPGEDRHCSGKPHREHYVLLASCMTPHPIHIRWSLSSSP